MAAPSGSPRRFRLQGAVEGTVRSYLLLEGRLRVGSVPGNDIVLPVRGVSRFHALLSPAGDGVEVQDLDSKNGTLVNGARIESGRLEPGGEVQFGPARFRLEEVDAEDAELAFSMPSQTGGAEANPTAMHTTTAIGAPRRASAGPWLSLIEGVLDRLSVAPEPDVDGALRGVVADLPVSGACLVEWGDRGEAVVVAAAGRIESPLDHAGFLAFVGEASRRAPGEQIATAILSGEPVLSCGLLSGHGIQRSALVVWGEFPERQSSEPLLRLLLRILDRFRPKPLAVGERRVGQPLKGLEFPPGYVPGDSPAMVSLHGQMLPLVGGDMPVLILGETGVGKEHLARTLHNSSPRRRGPFVAVNCAAIPSDLLEAEMFGIGKGVATGVAERVGKFQLADGGTLFLDEIGDMPLELQAKLLRALQEKEIHPLGSARPLSVDIRVLAATNSDLLARVEAGRFRRDVYYRVAGFVLSVPPLRQRREDIPALVEAFVQGFSRETGKAIRGVTVKALRVLTEHGWPGNIRELEHEVRRLVYTCPGGEAIDSAMLSPHVFAPSASDSVHEEPIEASLLLEAHLGKLEARLIRAALERTGGNRTEAAKQLGISRNGLAIKMERLGLTPAATE